MRSQDYAYLADHAYDRDGDLARKVNQIVKLGDVDYRILAHVDKRSGYQGTIYQRQDTGEIVVAHRGTEFKRESFKDLGTDAVMVAARRNLQGEDAIALTRLAMDMAENPRYAFEGRRPEVTVTGHSLGGTLAQITAHHFDLRGETFNAYGAASLNYRIPAGDQYKVLNHVMAADMVSSASPHFGPVRVYATQPQIDHLVHYGYDNNRSRWDLRNDVGAGINALKFHDMHYFLPIDGDKKTDVSILSDQRARPLAAQFDPMIDKYRADVLTIRAAATMGIRGRAGVVEDVVDHLRGDLPPGEPHRREQQKQGRTSTLEPGDMRDPSHSGHQRYCQVYAGICDIDRSIGRTPDASSERLAGALAANTAHLPNIERVTLSTDGSRVIAMDTEQSTGLRRIASVETGVGIAQPMEESSRQWFSHMEQQQLSSQTLQQQVTRNDAMQQAAPVRSV